MILLHHKGLKPERWFKFSLMEQLANVASEIERTINYKTRFDDLSHSKNAFERALELIDLTIADPKNRRRLKEIVRARELLVDHFIYKNEYNTTDKSWQKYFYGFSYAAAIERGR